MNARRDVTEKHAASCTLRATVCADENSQPGGVNELNVMQVDDEVADAPVYGVVQHDACIGNRGYLEVADDDDQIALVVRPDPHVTHLHHLLRT